MLIRFINKEQLKKTQLNFTLNGIKEPLTNHSNDDYVACFRTENIQMFFNNYQNEIGWSFNMRVDDDIYVLEILESNQYRVKTNHSEKFNNVVLIKGSIDLFSILVRGYYKCTNYNKNGEYEFSAFKPI